MPTLLRKLLASLRPAQAVQADAAAADESFFDLDLDLSRYQRLEDSHQRVVLRTTIEGQQVGLTVDLHPDWKPDLLNAMIPVFWGKVSFYSIGPESDSLVRALARGYGRAAPAARMAPVIHFRALALKGDPADAAQQPIRMKLFHLADDPKDYAEVYTNLDVKNGRGELHEKDPGYREPLLRALTAAG